MNSEKAKTTNRKIIAITLQGLHEVMVSKDNFEPIYRGMSFQFVVFVARIIKIGKTITFSDETSTFSCDYRKWQQVSKLRIGTYYECLCQLKLMNTTFLPSILNMIQVDGNFITTHIARIITQEIEFRMQGYSKPESKPIAQRPLMKSEELYIQMRQWIIKKEQFTLEELEKEFQSKKYGDLFEFTLGRFEDDGFIGNMGDRYQYIG